MDETTRLRLEIDRLQDALTKAGSRPVFCLYCDKSFPGDAIGQELLRRHVAQCQAHPLGRLLRVAETVLAVCVERGLPYELEAELRAAIAAAKDPAAAQARGGKRTARERGRP